MKTTTRYQVAAPVTPGAIPINARPCATLQAARKMARELSAGRPWLTYQDVRIERADGTFVEYAGPCR